MVQGPWRNPITRTILCDVSRQEVRSVVANFGAELAAKQNARLILEQIIPAQERADPLGPDYPPG